MYCIAEESKVLLGIIGFIIAIALLLTSMNIQSVNVVNSVEYRVDSATETLMTIDYEHHEIHAGSHFYVCDAETLGSGESADFAILTPDTLKWTHMTFSVEGQSSVSIIIYEDSDFVMDGTPVTAYNNNRNSNTTTTLNITRNPTVNVLGTQIFKQSKGEKREEGLIGREREIILKQNTKYIFRITNEVVNDNIISYCGEWYEHTQRGTI